MAFLAGLAGSATSAIGTAVSVAGSVVGMIGAYNQAKYQQAVAKNNEIIAKRNADMAGEQTQSEQQIQDQKTAAMLGALEADQASSGLSGTSQLRTRNSAKRLGRLDAFNIRTAGSRDIQGFLQQAEGFRSEAANAGKSATGSLLSGFLDVGSTLVGAAQSTNYSFTGKTSPSTGAVKERPTYGQGLY